MNILIIYGKSDYCTVRHYEDYLRRSKEHKVMAVGINGTDMNTPQQIVLSEVLTKIGHNPDLILSMEGGYPMLIHGIEQTTIPTAYYGIDTHMHKENSFEEAKKYKYVFFAQKKGVKDFIEETEHKNCYWIPLCADPMFHNKLELSLSHDVCCVAGIDLKEVHLKRRKCLRLLIDSGIKTFVGKASGIWLGYIYNKAKIGFNCSVNDDLNQRCFEIMACKRLLLTDKLTIESGIDDLFISGTDYVSYTDEKDCLEKVKYYLAHEEERLKITESGYKKVIEKHTYEVRMKEMICQMTK